MRYFLALVFAFMLSITHSQAAVLVIEGNYQGKNLYVQNPFSSSGVGFCAYEVTVNGEVTTDEVNNSAFEIDFTNFKLQIGEKVIVTVKHKNDCTPKILNAEALKPKSTFEVAKIYVDKNQVLHWNSVKETGVLPYIVEQYRWNKWVRVGEVQGKGTTDTNKYAFQITPHAGENQFRLKQLDYTGRPRYSSVAKFYSNIDPVTKDCDKCKDVIALTAPTLYEIYDSYGNIVKRGFGDQIDISDFKKSQLYYINYDNKTENFVKK